MVREEQALLQILRAYLHREAPRLPEDTDWDRLTKLAHIHNVSGILGYMTLFFPLCPDAQRVKAFRGTCLGTMAACANRAALAQQLSESLSREGIDHIAMKGFVLRHFYPVPELRTFGDIDLVISQEDRVRCHEFMISHGFGVKTDWEPVYSYTRGSEFYELHTQILEVDVWEKADHRGYFASLWPNAFPVDGCRWEFKPEFHFLYLLTHIAKHVTGSGAGIRMYLDVAVFLQHYGDSLDWAFVHRKLKELELEKFAGTVLALVAECFGIPSPIAMEPVSPEVLGDFLELTMAGGIFGRSAGDSGVDSLKRDSRNGEGISRRATLLRRLFPGAKSIESRYTYLQDKPWLLPVAWVHRLVKTRQEWRVHAREARNILTADWDTVAGLTRLYRDIGL